ncbi:MAG: IS91 family transposase [Thermodesulfobacteriota bacterium]
MSRPAFEVADIFRQYGKAYRTGHKLTRKQHQVMWAIEHCRTDRMGYHVDQCYQCGYTEQAFNSCRDRHCPKCQGVARHQWVNSRLEQILPVSYYHSIFTLPHDLNPLAAYNRRLIFNLLFDSSAQTLLAFGRDPQRLGGEIGFYGILHTWGQTLWPHPHVHYIVPGGALTKDGRWINAPHRSKFLFPVRALSKVFRGKFIDGLKKAYHEGRLILPDDELADARCFELWLDRLTSRKWVVYCKAPFKKPEQVVRYIGRYTHRVAISNQRLINIDQGQIRFRYKDYKKNRIGWQEMALSAQEFIKRFLWNVLPAGFHKIRHYGFMANSRCRERIATIINLLSEGNSDKTIIAEGDSAPTCPRCKTGDLIPIFIYSLKGTIIRNRWLLNTS